MQFIARLPFIFGYILVGYWLYKEGGEAKEWLIDSSKLIKEKLTLIGKSER